MPEHEPPDGDGPDAVLSDRLRGLAAADAAVYTPADPDALRTAPPPLLAASGRARRRGRIGFLVAAAVLVALLAGALALTRPAGEPLGVGGPGSTPGTAGTVPGSRVAPLANADHWHAAYAFSVCGVFVEPLQDPEGKPDLHGIHTHGDGVIHIHPFRPEAAGANARLQVFGDMVGVRFGASGWEPAAPGLLREVVDCQGADRFVAYEWDVDNLTVAPRVHTGNFGDIRFERDRSAFTFSLERSDRPVPPAMPPSVAELDRLTDTAPMDGGIELDPVSGATVPAGGS